LIFREEHQTAELKYLQPAKKQQVMLGECLYPGIFSFRDTQRNFLALNNKGMMAALHYDDKRISGAARPRGGTVINQGVGADFRQQHPSRIFRGGFGSGHIQAHQY